MASHLMSAVINYVGASIGAFYLVNDDEGSEICFELVGQYGGDEAKVKKQLSIGEGYLGACYKEKSKLIIDNLPENYIVLESGLGKTSLKCLTIIPLILDQKVNGALEFATYSKFSPDKILLLEKLGENLASSIEIIKVNNRMKNLVGQLNAHTEELNAQKEEMSQNLEEMMATQEEIDRIRTLEKQKEGELKELEIKYADLLKKYKALNKNES
jgi:hypothetical protein